MIFLGQWHQRAGRTASADEWFRKAAEADITSETYESVLEKQSRWRRPPTT
jgi:hypothetical protein